MGLLDQLAKKTFAEEMPGIAGDAIAWQDPPEIVRDGEDGGAARAVEYLASQ